MKCKLLAAVIAVVFVLAMPAMGQRPPASQPTDPVARLETRIFELEKRIAALESQLAKLTSPTPATTQPEVAGVRAAKPGDVPLVLDDWDYKFVEGEFGQASYRITLRLRNAGEKQIKLVEASVQFTDLLDKSLYGITVSPDITIAPGKPQVEQGNYHINQFISAQSRMKDMKKADIKATLQVRRLVFSDNTVLQVER